MYIKRNKCYKYMPSNSTEYMREYRRKMYAEEPEKCRQMRSKKYARKRYDLTLEEAKIFDEHTLRAGKIRELLKEINDPVMALKICGKYLNCG